MRVEDVQTHLESINGVRCDARVEDFVVDRDAACALGCKVRADEELLVYESAEGQLELALYLAPDLVVSLERMSLSTIGDALETELASYCQVVEGVSHFMYMAQTAGQERTVSLLELEAQAEVDKFAMCLMHRWQEPGRKWARELHQRLFDQVSYLETLSKEERWRYGEANRLARNYCGKLVPHFMERRLDRMLSALRYSYRLGAEAKLLHLAH